MASRFPSAAEEPAGRACALPNFVRLAWASEDIRAAHADRLARIARAWEALEWRSVSEGLRQCALRLLYLQDYSEQRAAVARAGLELVPLRIEEVIEPGAASGRMIMHAAIGSKRDAKRFKDAWIADDVEEKGRLLGYPYCCRACFADFFLRQGRSDPNWQIARNTDDAEIKGNTVTVDGWPELNILLRAINIRAVPHLPCCFDCQPSLDLARTFLDLARQLGYAEEADWLCEMLAWPAEFSMLHGIAEIRTPIMKIATQTDATPQKYVVRWLGRAFPPDGARGLSFPYTQARPASIRDATNAALGDGQER